MQENTLFVGDSINDQIGAQEANVGFVGVTYGFGFSRSKTYDFTTVNVSEDILKIIE